MDKPRKPRENGHFVDLETGVKHTKLGRRFRPYYDSSMEEEMHVLMTAQGTIPEDDHD